MCRKPIGLYVVKSDNSHLSNETLLAAADASAMATGVDWGRAQTAKAGENLALVEA